MTKSEIKMDPATEVVLYGSDLRDGMRVRRDLNYVYSSDTRLMAGQEFCTVTKLRRYVHDNWLSRGNSMPMMDFIGVFEDGHQEAHSAGEHAYAWVVRRDSLPFSHPDHLPMARGEVFSRILAQLVLLENAIKNLPA